MRIGILAVQGAFIEHEKQLVSIADHFDEQIECIEIRQKTDLENLNGIILPGGESTVQGKLIRDLEIFNTLQAMILTVQRNAYGRQLGSFSISSNVGEIENFPLVFIRAPYITNVSPDTKRLVSVDQHIVGVEYKNQIGLAFHPEMTNDTRIHEYFLQKVKDFCC